MQGRRGRASTLPAYRSTRTTSRCEKRHFLRHLYIKTNILPRQARDKHRENSKKSGVFRREPLRQRDDAGRCACGGGNQQRFLLLFTFPHIRSEPVLVNHHFSWEHNIEQDGPVSLLQASFGRARCQRTRGGCTTATATWRSGEETVCVFLRHLFLNNAYFTKTGSGQT